MNRCELAVKSPWAAPADEGGRARSAMPATPRPPSSAFADRPTRIATTKGQFLIPGSAASVVTTPREMRV